MINSKKQIHFKKENSQNILDHEKHYRLIREPRVGNNYITTCSEYMTFSSILDDFCIFPIVYYDEESVIVKGCEYEIRICPYVFINILKNGIPPHQIRYDLYEDAWFGRGNIFSRQIDPENPLGLNVTNRLMDSTNDFFAFFREFIQIRSETLPENGVLEGLSQYRDVVQLVNGIKICDYQIRLFYDDPYKHFKDIVSAFNFINQGIGERFDFIVDPE